MGDDQRREQGEEKPARPSVDEASGVPPVEFEQTLMPADEPPEGDSGADEDFEGTFLSEDPPQEDEAPPAAAVGGQADWPEVPDVDLEQEIGRGGMGVVYSGRQRYLDRKVAVKLLAITDRGPTFAARFQREAKILASLSHPHVVSCHQAGTLPDGKCFMVMEFIDGPNLLEWIKENGAMPVDRALSLCRDVALALECAFEKTVIHRDVKPANVLLQRDAGGDASFPFKSKLADLGLARGTSDESTMMELTVQGAVMGSPPTMAPEQFDDPDNVDYRADIYGLGCTLYHMLTGCLAFPQQTLTAAIASKMSEVVPDPCALQSDLHPGVAEFVRAMLARRPEDRPQSYGELVETCDALLGELDGAPSASAQKRGTGMLWGGVGVAVAALGAVGLYVGLGGDDAEPQDPASPVAALGTVPENGGSPSAGEELQNPAPRAGAEPQAPVEEEEPGETLQGAQEQEGAALDPGLQAAPTEAPEGVDEQVDEPRGAGDPGAGESSLESPQGSTPSPGAAPAPGEAQEEEGQTPPAAGAPPVTETEQGTLDPDPVPVEGSGGAASEAPAESASPRLLPQLVAGQSLRLFGDDKEFPLADWEMGASEQESFSIQGVSVLCSTYRDSVYATHPVPEGDWRLSGKMRLAVGREIRNDFLTRVQVEFEGGTALAFEMWTGSGLIQGQVLRMSQDGDGWTSDSGRGLLKLDMLDGADVKRALERMEDPFTAFDFTWKGGVLAIGLEREGESRRSTEVSADPQGAFLRPIRIGLRAEGCKALYEDFAFSALR